MNRNDLRTGLRVMFTGKRNVTVYGSVKRVNPKSITLDNCSDGPRGWRVNLFMLSPADANDPGIAATNAPAGTRPWRKGDRVEFDYKGKTFTGSITRVNARTCSINPDVPERPGQYFRMSPNSLRPTTGVTPTGTPVAPPDTTAADKRNWERYAAMYDLPVDGFGKTITVRGEKYRITGINTRRPKNPVSILRLRDNSIRKCGPGFVKPGFAAAPKARRDDWTILDEITGCYSRLSPENLTCDGELSASQSRTKAAGIRRELRTLFVEFGSTLTEGGAWAAYEKAMEAA